MDPNGYPTTAPLFIGIIAVYVLLSLFLLGGKKLFFEPFVEPPEEKDVTPKPQA